MIVVLIYLKLKSKLMILSNIEGIGKWSKIEIEVRCDECSIEKKLKFITKWLIGFIETL